MINILMYVVILNKNIFQKYYLHLLCLMLNLDLGCELCLMSRQGSKNLFVLGPLSEHSVARILLWNKIIPNVFSFLRDDTLSSTIVLFSKIVFLRINTSLFFVLK